MDNDRKPSMADAESILDKWIRDGNLSVDDVKAVTQLNGQPEIRYRCMAAPGLTVLAALYSVEEGGKIRDYIWIEVGLARPTHSTKLQAYELLLQFNQRFPGPLKIGFNEDLVVLVFRSSLDGMSLEYLRETVQCVIPESHGLYAKLRDQFSLKNPREAFEEEKMSRVH